jgi:hypothetical protein
VGKLRQNPTARDDLPKKKKFGFFLAINIRKTEKNINLPFVFVLRRSWSVHQ